MDRRAGQTANEEESFTEEERASLAQSEALWRKANAIVAIRPALDAGDVFTPCGICCCLLLSGCVAA